ncbi:hypothetical protein GKZ89_09835 [Bacillus mangrovi]|uniref:DUF5082 domain-containing protein n=1 Tax=Metabacillus mangrovi TaxID=1491830 RepID=A0A7X2S4S3_9BACI|nr:hypothetical protein [Metabacillus mangrovi]MTH53703.1 hypothetical protein [Metabacillus mangrovi]
MIAIQEAALQEALREKREQLSLLIQCQATLNSIHSGLQSSKHLCLEPKLENDTWAGQHADKFDEIRDKGLLEEYEDIEGKQMNSVLEKLGAKIQSLSEEIKDSQNALAKLALESKTANLYPY